MSNDYASTFPLLLLARSMDLSSLTPIFFFFTSVQCPTCLGLSGQAVCVLSLVLVCNEDCNSSGMLMFPPDSYSESSSVWRPSEVSQRWQEHTCPSVVIQMILQCALRDQTKQDKATPSEQGSFNRQAMVWWRPSEQPPSRKPQPPFVASLNVCVFLKQATLWTSDLSPSSPSVTTLSTLQSPSESVRSVQVHKLFTRQWEESQSTGNTEITWVTRTKPPITKLAWHRFKAFNFAQQTLNSPFLALPASLPHLPTLVLCIHYPVCLYSDRGFWSFTKSLF